MKKKVTGVSIGALLVLAAIPWGVGHLVEHVLCERVERLAAGADAMLRTRLVRYERGWLTSKAVHRVELVNATAFEIHHVADHLPRVGEGWARVRSVPLLSADAQALADHYFGSSAPMTADTVVGFDGSLSVSLRSPAFAKALTDEPDVRFTWGGAQGSLHVDSRGSARMLFEVPGLAMHGQGVVATFADLRVDGDWRSTADAWSGRTSMSVSAIGLSSPEGGARLRRLEAAFEREDLGKTIALSCRVRVGEGTSLDAGAEDGFRDGAIDIHLDRLGKEALRTYLERMARLPAALPESEQTRVNARMALALLADLLEGAPRLRIERARLTTPNGSFAASGVLAIDPVHAGAGDRDLLSRLRLDARVEVSARLLEGWMARDTYRGVSAALLERSGEVDEQFARDLTERFVRERIEVWTSAGILAADRDRYRVQIDLARGHLRVNGVPSDALLPGRSADPGPAPGDIGTTRFVPPRRPSAPVSGQIASVP